MCMGLTAAALAFSGSDVDCAGWVLPHLVWWNIMSTGIKLPAADILYDLVNDIPDVMGLRAIQPSAAIVKVMSVPDSHCVRVVTPDDHVNIGFHEILSCMILRL